MPASPSQAAKDELEETRPEDRGSQWMDIGDIFTTAREGRENAWVTLIDRLSTMIRSIARSYRLSYDDVGEVTQTAWLRLLENADCIREPNAVGAWLAVTARRECIKATRSRARERSMETELFAESLGASDDDVDLPGVRSERQEALAEALETLPDHQRLLLRAMMVEPAPSYSAISQALEVPIGSIGPTRGRALVRLRENGALRAAFED